MKTLLYIILIVLTVLLGLFWSVASAEPNPAYIPLIHACSDYASRCGEEFKKALSQSNYRVCKAVEGEVCQEWYNPTELHYVFNALPGWKD